MTLNYDRTQKKLYILLIAIGIMILALSMEVLMVVKDRALFLEWYEEIMASNPSALSEEEAFDTYVSGQIFLYMLNLAIPVGLALHTFYSYVKKGINRLFIYLWTIMLLGGLAFTAISLNFDSLFYYIRIILYFVLIGTTLSLSKEVANRKN